MDNFHCTVMMFGLQNVGATYQHVMTTIFHSMLHDCLEDQVDDIVIRSKEKRHHVVRCRRYNLWMNC